MTTPDGNILTTLMTDFTKVTALSTQAITGYALKVLVTLITIDLIIAIIVMLIEDGSIGQAVIKRTIKYGAFMYMVVDYKTIINALGDSFVMIGLKAAGGTLSEGIFTDPSQISTMGFNMIMPFISNMTSNKANISAAASAVDVVTSLPTTILLGLTYLLILFCFFAIAVNIFVVYIEFAILTSIGLILVPFGVWDKTEFIFDKIKNGIITFGIKFMTLAFVVSISFNMIKSWQLPADPTFQQALYVLIGMIAITYLCHHAPSVAAGIASGGGGSMTGAGVGGFVGGAVGGAVGNMKSMQKALIGDKKQNGERSGIIPTIGRATGLTDKINDYMGDSKSSKSTPSANTSPVTPATTSGADLTPSNPGMEYHKANNTSSVSDK